MNTIKYEKYFFKKRPRIHIDDETSRQGYARQRKKNDVL